MSKQVKKRNTQPLILAIISLVVCSVSNANEQKQSEFFEHSVLPLLTDRCYECHSHEAASAEGGLVLDSPGGWKTGGDSGTAIQPGNAKKSLLYTAVAYTDDDLRMPPDSRLSDEEIAVFRRWIDDGAFDPRQAKTSPTQSKSASSQRSAEPIDLWSLRPLAKSNAYQGGIDHFINRRIKAEGLAPNPKSDRATLLRRATFGLTGLPPTPEELEQFQQDDRDDALDRLIDRLLDSPRYGERWGRHWLDLARYGDSNGADINYAHANAWRYRDYVIESFNADKPYDDFVTEQLAGDLLAETTPHRRRELLTATGFLMLGPKMLAEVDGAKLLIDVADEQLDVLGKTFLGMTFGCARCHDHKFDPISIKDYYALAGILRSTKTMDSLRPQKVVGEWVEIDVTPPELQSRIKSLTAEKKELDSRISAFGQSPNSSKKNMSAAHSVVLARDLPNLESTTWAARVRIDSPQSLGAVVSADYKGASQGHSLGFDRIHNGRAPRVVWNHNKRTTIITASEPISLGEWHHLAVTYDADTEFLALYVDGEPAASQEGVPSTPFSKIGVGRREAPKEFQLIGDIDDVVVYDSALTQEEIVILDAGQQLARIPLFHWDFESIQDGKTIDATGKHDGQLIRLKPESNIIEDGFRGKGLSLRSHGELSSEEQERLVEWRERRKAIDAAMPKTIRVMAVQEDDPIDLPVHIRGNHTNPTSKKITRTTPVIFESNLPSASIDSNSNGRLELAKWITDPNNPLTARVMVNRIWQQHFGQGLVATPSNFGIRGEQPSHPELLDWLASEFIRSGWSLKHMHRLIMTSDVYQRGSDGYADAKDVDPDNRLLARFPVRRLEAEAIRDSLLAISGELKLGSPGNLMKSPNMKRVAMTPTDPVYQSHYRGVYLPVIRVRGYEMFAIFDVTDSGQHVDRRPQTMVSQQALFLLNNPFVAKRAEQVVNRYISQDSEKGFPWLYRLILGRDPSASEVALLEVHFVRLRESLSSREALQAIVHSLFCSNEFIHIR